MGHHNEMEVIVHENIDVYLFHPHVSCRDKTLMK